MIPRLRSLVIDDKRVILVLDRTGSLSPEEAGFMTAALTRTAERLGLAGALVFPNGIDLGEDSE